MNTSYLFLAEGFEETEAVVTIDLLRRAGIKLTTVSISEYLEVKGAHGIELFADELFKNIHFEKVDWLILPGGMPGTKNLDKHKGLNDLLSQHAAKGGFIAAICAAPSVLGRLGILSGKKATSYPGFEGLLEGARVTGNQVEVDGNIVTGNGPAAAIPFALSIIKKTLGEDFAKGIAEQL